MSSARGAAAEVSTRTEHAIQNFTMSRGLRLLVKEDHRLPFVEFRAVFQGGVLAETPENNGITQLTSQMLLKGTARRSAEVMHAKSNRWAAALTVTAGTTASG